MFCPRRMKPLTLCMQEGSHSTFDITTHISTNPTILVYRTRTAADDITGNGSQPQTVHRRISLRGKENEIKSKSEKGTQREIH